MHDFKCPPAISPPMRCGGTINNEPQPDPDVLAILRRLEGDYSRRELIQVLQHDIGLKTRELADFAGVSSETILQWDESEVPPSAERLDDLGALVALLLRSGTFRPGGAADWLRRPHPAFSLQRPLDMLRRYGYLSVVVVMARTSQPLAPQGRDNSQTGETCDGRD